MNAEDFSEGGIYLLTMDSFGRTKLLDPITVVGVRRNYSSGSLAYVRVPGLTPKMEKKIRSMGVFRIRPEHGKNLVLCNIRDLIKA
jgi:hypothetical protein